MRSFLISLCLLLSLSPVFSSGGKETSPSGGGNPSREKLSVFVTIPPLAYLADRIGGEYVRTESLVSGNDDPHTYQLKPSQVMALGGADVYFIVGLGYEEAFLPSLREALPGLAVADLSDGVDLIPFAGEHDHPGEGEPGEDEHGEEADHHHENPWDPHIWLGIPQAVAMADHIREELTARLPEHRDLFQANFEAFRAAAEALDRETATLLAPLKGSLFFVFHQAFGYFAGSYGLVQEAVETGGREPSPRQVEALIRRAEEEQVRAIFVQPQFSQASAGVIARAIGGRVVSLDPLAYDWADNLRRMARAVAGGGQ